MPHKTRHPHPLLPLLEPPHPGSGLPTFAIHCTLHTHTHMQIKNALACLLLIRLQRLLEAPPFCSCSSSSSYASSSYTSSCSFRCCCISHKNSFDREQKYFCCALCRFFSFSCYNIVYYVVFLGMPAQSILLSKLRKTMQKFVEFKFRCAALKLKLCKTIHKHVYRTR